MLKHLRAVLITAALLCSGHAEGAIGGTTSQLVTLCPAARGGGMVDGHGMEGRPVDTDKGFDKPKDTAYLALVSDVNTCESRPGTTQGKTASWTLLAEKDRGAVQHASPSPSPNHVSCCRNTMWESICCAIHLQIMNGTVHDSPT